MVTRLVFGDVILYQYGLVVNQGFPRRSSQPQKGVVIGGSKGEGTRDAPGSKFFHFQQKKWQNKNAFQ